MDPEDEWCWKCKSCHYVNKKDNVSCLICYKYPVINQEYKTRRQLERDDSDTANEFQEESGHQAGDEDIDSWKERERLEKQESENSDKDDGSTISNKSSDSDNETVSDHEETNQSWRFFNWFRFSKRNKTDNNEKVLQSLQRKYKPLTRDQAVRIRDIAGENKFDELEIVKAVKLMGSTTYSAIVRYLRKSRDQRRKNEKVVDDLLVNGGLANKIKARLAAQLIEMGHCQEMAVKAAKQCGNIEDAQAYLSCICPICMDCFSHDEMFVMLYCQDQCCNTCTEKYFTTTIREKSILEAICPFCDKPDLKDANVRQEYFGRLLPALSHVLVPEVYELFQNKLRDQALKEDPEFVWCNSCKGQFGFCLDQGNRKMVCPNCNNAICSQCKEVWIDQHDGISCEKFKKWKRKNNAEFLFTELEKYLQDNGIVCPRCTTKFALSRGGCIHFTCTNCKYEFCGHCQRPFYNNAELIKRCPFSDECTPKGLHAHHPRNCHYYLREFSFEYLIKLLDDRGVPYEKANPTDASANNKCPINLQKEINGSLRDERCGEEVETDSAGVCRTHYVEYLCSIILKRNIDPTPIMDESELQAELRRNFVKISDRGKNESEFQYKTRMIKMISEEIPLSSI